MPGIPSHGMVDGHLHPVTSRMLERLRERRWPVRAQVLERLTGEGGWLEKRLRALRGVTMAQLSARWTEAFDKAGVATGFFIAVGEVNDCGPVPFGC